jgi:hypothetical protein
VAEICRSTEGGEGWEEEKEYPERDMRIRCLSPPENDDVVLPARPFDRVVVVVFIVTVVVVAVLVDAGSSGRCWRRDDRARGARPPVPPIARLATTRPVWIEGGIIIVRETDSQ